MLFNKSATAFVEGYFVSFVSLPNTVVALFILSSFSSNVEFIISILFLLSDIELSKLSI